MSEKDLILEELERKHNLYKSKVIKLPAGTTFNDLKAAIKKHIMSVEDITGDVFATMVERYIHRTPQENFFNAVSLKACNKVEEKMDIEVPDKENIGSTPKLVDNRFL